MKITDKIKKWFTWLLIFTDEKWEYFTSIHFESVKTEIRIFFILKEIYKKKTGKTDLDELNWPELSKFFSKYKVKLKK